MKISIDPKKVLTTLVAVTLALATTHIVTSYLRSYTNVHEYATGALVLFDMDAEVSIPTWYAQLLLAAASFLLLTIGVAKRRSTQKYYKHWIALGFMFVYISMDEGSQIHELLVSPLRDFFNTSGTLLNFAWVIGGALVTSVIAVIYFRFWLNLPSKTRLLFLASAAIFIGGALGIEMIGGYYLSNHGYNFGYQMITLIEETMEKMGIALFIYTLLDYMKYAKIDIDLRIKPSNLIE